MVSTISPRVCLRAASARISISNVAIQRRDEGMGHEEEPNILRAVRAWAQKQSRRMLVALALAELYDQPTRYIFVLFASFRVTPEMTLDANRQLDFVEAGSSVSATSAPMIF